jgi:hypothetical protein
MRWILAALLMSITAANAQTPMTGTNGAPASTPPAAALEQSAPASAAPAAQAPAAPHRTRRTLQERFDAANTTHDGHLTLEQARSKMPSVARDFAAIDTDHKGYVTIDQIKAHSRAARAAKRAAKEQH